MGIRYRQTEPLDGKGLHSLMRFLNIRVTGRPGGVLVTGVLDPRLFTTGRTLASSSNSVYSFVVVDLKEVVHYAGGQKVIEFVPC